MIESLLSIDVGTSSLKAVLYDLNGNVLEKESAAYTYVSPQSGWAEENPMDWWEACCQTCRKITREQKYQIKGIAVSGQSPSCVPIDRRGEPVRPAILWLDRRADPQAQWLKDHHAGEISQISAMNTIDSYFGGVKWLWYRKTEPQNYANTWKIVQANGYILYQLTGEIVIDPGQAGICSPLLDEKQMQWSDDLCNLLEIDCDKLPEILPAGDVIGEVTQKASEDTGLEAGILVVCGTADYICSFLGSGALDKATASIMLGTAGNLMFLSPPRVDARMLNTYYFDNEILSTGGVMAGGAVSWFSGMLKMNTPQLLGQLEKEAAETIPGSAGLIFLPYLMGERSPIWDAEARGVFLGLSTSHERGHLYRAVLEGVAYAFHQLQEILKGNGAQIEQVVVINGGSCSSLWRQIIADVMEIPLHYRPQKDGTSLGSAFLAGKGIGLFNGWEDIQSWLLPPVTSLPDEQHQQIYRGGYQVYAQMYETLKGSFQALRELRKS